MKEEKILFQFENMPIIVVCKNDNEERFLFLCAYSAHDPYPTFDIQFINADGNEDETEFTCESGQNIVHSLRELHDFYEDFRKDNPGIKKIIQVIYMGTDSHYIPNKGEE